MAVAEQQVEERKLAQARRKKELTELAMKETLLPDLLQDILIVLRRNMKEHCHMEMPPKDLAIPDFQDKTFFKTKVMSRQKNKMKTKI